METLKVKKQVEMLEMKTSINQIKTTVDSIISRQDQAEEKISEMEDKINEILLVDNHKEKKIMNTHDHNIQELWDMTKDQT
jgi:TolA-binding protein